ncbi:MAG: HPr family phosphocarrier protein [Pirellulales bacterium]|nr:HPr family phosphocarrier protein [Pirellulales bacterium]
MSETSIRRTVVVTDPQGVHIRTALAITKVVGRGKSEVKLVKQDRRTMATEVLQILSLVVEPGERVEIEAIGPDAAEVADALEPLFAGKFDSAIESGEHA